MRERGGNVAIIFAFATLPIVGAIGATIDFSHANSAKTAMQAALDSTALMLSREAASLNQSELDAKALTYFKTMFARPEATNIVVSTKFTTGGGSAMLVEAAADIPTAFVGILGLDKITLKGTSQSKWGSARLRVALALDTTGSMDSDGKIAALKSATKSLLSQLQAAASTNGDIYVSIVPFARTVNLGANNYGATWIDWTAWESEPPILVNNKPGNWEQTGPGDPCPLSNAANGFVCTTGPTNGSSSTSTIPMSGNYTGYICPGIDNGSKDSARSRVYYNGCYNSIAATRTISSGWNASCGTAVNCSCSGSGSSKTCTQSYYTHTWISNARSTWNGCIADRGSAAAPGTTAGNDQKATTPSTGDITTLFPAQQYAYCSQTAMGLSYDWSSMSALVDGLSASGSTNQPIGLVTAWHSLVGVGPFSIPAKEAGYTYYDVIILLSDGLNTQDRWYGNGSSTSSAVDYRMYDTAGNGTCANVKAAGVTIYTIQVNTGGDPTSTLLKNCASSSSKFFLLTSANQIVTTFTTIGTNLTQLHLAK